jgi:hypothetical protein
LDTAPTEGRERLPRVNRKRRQRAIAIAHRQKADEFDAGHFGNVEKESESATRMHPVARLTPLEEGHLGKDVANGLAGVREHESCRGCAAVISEARESAIHESGILGVSNRCVKEIGSVRKLHAEDGVPSVELGDRKPDACREVPFLECEDKRVREFELLCSDLRPVHGRARDRPVIRQAHLQSKVCRDGVKNCPEHVEHLVLDRNLLVKEQILENGL